MGGQPRASSAYYEKDARSIITIWGGSLTDYAGRQWNGLMRDYYLPRWQVLIDATLAELKGGKPVDRQALEQQWREHDLKFATTTRGHYAVTPHGDFFAMSRALYKKYAPGGARQRDDEELVRDGEGSLSRGQAQQLPTSVCRHGDEHEAGEGSHRGRVNRREGRNLWTTAEAGK